MSGVGLCEAGAQESSIAVRAPQSRRASETFKVRNQFGKSIGISVPAELFREGLQESDHRLGQNISRGIEGMPALVSAEDKILHAIASALTRGACSAHESAHAINEWVNEIISNEGKRNPLRRGYPLETLLLRSGTAVDRVVLAVSMCRAIGIEAVIMRYENRLFPGIPNTIDDTGRYFRGNLFTPIASRAGQIFWDKLEICGPWVEGKAKIFDEFAKSHVFSIPADVITDRILYKGSRRVGDLSPRKISAIIASDHRYLKPIAEVLCKHCVTNEEKADALLRFVQGHVRYTFDRDGIDSLQFPVETLLRKLGDCEDSALLFAGLCQEVGIDVVLLNPRGHLAVGVAGDFLGDFKIYNGKRYYYAETTAVGYSIGYTPPERGGETRIIPLQCFRALRKGKSGN